MLTALRDYLQQHRQATLAEIVHHFKLDPEVARQMLAIWVRKGKVHKQQATAACGASCRQCDPTVTEVYLWAGEEVSLPLPPNCRQGD